MQQIQSGTLVDHFKVTHLIGHGAMGMVYLGRDEHLGRRVAIKVIHPKYLRSDGAFERFLNEARTTAQFSHPHIVTIYAVGQYEGQPYLAMEYLRGQNLRQRMSEDRSNVDSLRVGLAIAQALAEAHSHGVVHRDLKPENVVIPQDGRPRVLDFGLAASNEGSLAQDEQSSPESPGGRRLRRSGTPAYMAPEQWRHGHSSTASDIWALGVLLYELVVGHRPFFEYENSIERLALRVSDGEPVSPAEALEQVPQALRELILQCLDKAPESRLSAAEVASRLQQQIERRLQPSQRERCPFPGLQPFEEGLAPLFFGRDVELDAFFERLRTEPILPIVGPSGAGKSSFVRAGIIPRLRERHSWIVIEVTPGTAPYLALGAALAGCLDSGCGPRDDVATVSSDGATIDWDYSEDVRQSQPSDPLGNASKLSRQLLDSPGLLGRHLRHLAEREKAHVLLFVDQLEELYTLVDEEAERRSFMEMLASAADDPRDPVRMIFTLRDDYLGRLAEGERVREALSRVTVLRSPGLRTLEEILSKPLISVGYRFEPPALARRMVEAVSGEAAALPLIQFTARLLWESRDRERQLLTEEVYESLGGVEGALAEHADGVLEGMTPVQVASARELLLRLTTPEGTRRVVSRNELLEGMQDEQEVLGKLIQARLVTVRRSLMADDAGAELELAHESLIRGWKRLSRWFDETREDLAFLATITPAAELWAERGRTEEMAWQGEALRDAVRDARRLRAVPQLVRDFLQAGHRREKRRLRRQRSLLAASITLLTLVAVGSTVGAIALAEKEEEAQRERRLAERQRRQAQEQSAEALREGARAAFLRGDLIQSRAMLRASLQEKISPLGRALWWRLSIEPLWWRRDLGGDVNAVAFDPNGVFIAAVADSPSVYVFRVDDMSQRSLRGHRQQPDDVAFSPDGRWLASTSSAGFLRIWDLARDSAEPVALREGAGGPMAFSANGKHLITGRRDGVVRVWSFDPPLSGSKGEPQQSLGVSERERPPIAAVAIDDEGELVAAGFTDGRVRLWKRNDGTLVLELQRSEKPVSSVAFHGTKRWLAAGGSDAMIRVWELEKNGELRNHGGEPTFHLEHQDAVRDLVFSPNGEHLFAGTAQGIVHVWQLDQQIQRSSIAAADQQTRSQVLALSVASTGQLFATGGNDNTLRLYRLNRSLVVEEDRGHTAAVLGVDFSPDGRTLVSGSNDQTLRLWNVATGVQKSVLRSSQPERLTGVVFDPVRNNVVAAGADGIVRIWDADSGIPRRSPAGPASYITALAVDPRQGEGEIATASFDGAIRLWSQSLSRPTRELYRHDAWATDVAFDPTGRFLASGGHDRSLRIWDLENSRLLRTLTDLPGEVHGLAFSSEGRQLAFSIGREPAQLWDIEKNVRVSVGHGESRIYWLDVHPDGQRLGLPRDDGTAHIVSIPQHGSAGDGEMVILRGHRDDVNYLRFSPDGRLAATTSDDGTVRLWDVETGRPRWWAPALLAHSPQVWTHRGWLTLSGGDSSPDERLHSRWREAIAREARFAVENSAGTIGCLLSFSGRLQRWCLDEDRALGSEELEDASNVVALSQGCLSLAQGVVRFHPKIGDPQIVARQARAIAPGRADQVLVAAGREVTIYSGDAEGNFGVHRRLISGAWVVVMLALDDHIVVGFSDGGLELLSLSESDGLSTFAFEGLPASAPTALFSGPRQTLIAGFQNGVVGIWSLENGSSHIRFRIHGPIRHLNISGSTLHVVSELGDVRTLDLNLLACDECQLLRSLWAEVPVVWDEGAPIRQAPPRDHRCAVRR